MKIRKPALIHWLGFLGAVLIRWWIGTLAFRYRPLGADLNPTRAGLQGRYIYVFWHENILVPCHSYAQRNIKVLISQHADGEIIAQVCRYMGFGTIRGSKTRGGMRAMREMMRASASCHIAVMPDGPRGPRRHLEMGLVYLAAKTGLPIVLTGIGHDRPWRLRTWDHFALPRPWSKAVVVTLDPVAIPENANKAQLEEYRAGLERALSDVTDYAERLASR